MKINIPIGSIASSDSIAYDSNELTIDFTAALKVPGTMDAMPDSFVLSPSGHGNIKGEENFASTDKLYLLSAHEV